MLLEKKRYIIDLLLVGSAPPVVNGILEPDGVTFLKEPDGSNVLEP